MQASILLFAQAREIAGQSTLMVELPLHPTVHDLKIAMSLACPSLEPMLPILRIALDSEYADNEDQLIPPGAELAVIPPVCGGSFTVLSTRS
jgi:molybdopterin converting factor small subunit